MDPLSRMWQQLVDIHARMMQMQTQMITATSMWAGGLEGIGKTFEDLQKQMQRMREVVLARIAAVQDELNEMHVKVQKIEEKLEKMNTAVTYGFAFE